MSCPNCGSQTNTDQQYCRTCGANLQAEPDLAVPSKPECKRESSGYVAATFFDNLMRSGLFVMFAGVMIGIIGGSLLNVRWVAIAGAMTSVVGMFLIAYSTMMPRTRTNIASAQPDFLKELPKTENTRKLTPMNDVDFIPSVTERTTELLETPRSDTNKQL